MGKRAFEFEPDMDTDLVTYYAQRAQEYERVYDKPERQADISYLIAYLQQALKGQSVNEIACGTGYWTQHIAQTVRSVAATDINSEVLEIAKRKAFPRQNVAFDLADIYALPIPKQPFDAGFGGFIWSHVSLPQLPDLITSLHRTIEQNGKVVWVDNRYVPGSSTPIAKRDAAGNTYQRRVLQSGEAHMILKNFPTETNLRNALGHHTSNIQVTWLTYFWILSYTIT